MPEEITPESWRIERGTQGDWNHIECDFDLSSDGTLSIFLDQRPSDPENNKWIDIDLTVEEARELTCRLAAKLFGLSADELPADS